MKKSQAADPSSAVPILLGPVSLLMFAAALLVLGARVREGQVIHVWDVVPWGLWWCSSAFLTFSLVLGKFQGSRTLASILILLSGVGVMVRARMAGAVEEVSGIREWIPAMGVLWTVLTWFLFRTGRVEMLRKLGLPAFLMALALPAGLLLLGTRFRGAVYGPGGMTPTEGLKILVPLALASFFSAEAFRWKGRSLFKLRMGPTLILATGCALLGGLLSVQRDLGMIVLLTCSLLAMLIAITRSWSWVVPAVVAAAGGGWLVFTTFEHGARRLAAWTDPFADPTGAGWQVLQGLSGLYAGGLTGTGLGGGRPDRIPIGSSDFVYAVYGEEVGFLGCVLLLVLFGLLYAQGVRIASIQSKDFSFLVAVGITAGIAGQVIVNIGGVVTLLPVTGIPLPYISQGGTSAWVTGILMGLLLALSEPGNNSAKPKRKKS